jgi:hypothetical protein
MLIDAIIFGFKFMLMGIGFLVVAFVIFCLILLYLERR